MRFPAPLLLLCVLCSQTLAAPLQTQASPESPALTRSPGRVKPQRLTVNDKPAYQKWTDEDVRWIMTPEERAAFVTLLTVEQKEQFIERFWVRRDPTPNTLENEFKDEHYRRIAYANVHFGAGSTPGWESDRGRAYIAYGPPDEIENHFASAAENQSGSGGESAGSPYQVWRYRRYQGASAVDENGSAWRQNGHELIFRFVDYCKCGEYRNTAGWPPLYEQAPVPPGLTVTVKGNNSPQVRFKELEQIASHKIWLNQVPFQIQTSSLKLTDYTALAPITVQLQNHDIRFTSSGGVERATLQILGRVMTSSGRVANIFEDTVNVEYPAGAGVSARPPNYRKILPLPPGEYWLDLVIKDVSGAKIGSRRHRFVVLDTVMAN